MHCGYCTHIATTAERLATHVAANHDTTHPPSVRVRFLYAQGQAVMRGEEPGTTWLVKHQRVTFRDVLGPVHEYGLVLENAPPHTLLTWAYEADLLPAD